VGVGDHQLDAPQAAPGEPAQEVCPEVLGLRGTDLHAQDLAPAIGVGAHRHYDRHRDDAAVLADFDVGGVDPQVGPVALDRPIQEGLHANIDLLAQPRDLALGDAAHAHGLDQVIHRTGRDPLDVGFLDHRGQRLLGQTPGLQKEREVAPLAKLGDAQLHRAGPRLPVPVAVAVPLSQPLNALLTTGGPGQAAHLQLHQPARAITNHLTQKISVRALLHQPAKGDHVFGHLRSSVAVDVATQP
jgi:hypothetical protein